jgi:protoporphyrinogen IX oxidase
MVAWTLVAHIFGLVLWVGGLLVTTVVMARHTREESPEARAALGKVQRTLLRGMADPGALLTILAGITLITTNRAYYLHAGWLHIKLTFVIVLIVLHGITAVKSKKLASGQASFPSGQAKFLFAAILVVFLSILIATLPGAVFLK